MAALFPEILATASFLICSAGALRDLVTLGAGRPALARFFLYQLPSGRLTVRSVDNHLCAGPLLGFLGEHGFERNGFGTALQLR